MSYRAGRYIKQPTGYRAFIPSPLPPNPPLQINARNQILLTKASVALGRLDGSIETLPDSDLFVFMYVRKEAVLSSQIEGTQSSIQDVLAAEAKIFSPDQPKDVDEVVNYVRAMNYGLDRLNELPISTRLFREIHKILLQDVRGTHLTPGEIRTTQNWIGPAGCTLDEATFVPPPPYEVTRCLSDLEKFLHSEVQLPLLIKIGLAHAQFETIHPFLDGNGRIGRLLITFLLCEKNVLKKPVLYLSYFFKQHRQDYYNHLQAIRDEGDWESWITFFLQGIMEVSEQATRTARAVLEMRDSQRILISNKFGNVAGNGHRLLDLLYNRPIVSVKDVQELIGTTYPPASKLVKRFVKEGFLKEITGQSRNRRFIFSQYIALFHDDQNQQGLPTVT